MEGNAGVSVLLHLGSTAGIRESFLLGLSFPKGCGTPGRPGEKPEPCHDPRSLFHPPLPATSHSLFPFPPEQQRDPLEQPAGELSWPGLCLLPSWRVSLPPAPGRGMSSWRGSDLTILPGNSRCLFAGSLGDRETTGILILGRENPWGVE